ncbi:RING/FYVE/PHD zinc finger superfamily protein isoform 3 [Hibiscus syriacus]|uniref:RING/FYVE/PHD zinc finger superfamily protein isoform 3 n=1 Tax=Hibiscus syriacus TaxID=106335 RepID=A0A6A3BUP6_HIBSY|nr:RING/FYVE/PHD zinc finger superfamily protein isoform 3 [Hibiscus syriacus]
MAMIDRLPTRDRLHRIGIVSNESYVLCNESLENRNHLFFECQTASQLRDQIFHLNGIYKTVLSREDLITWASKYWKGKSLLITILKLAWNATIYVLWEKRNRRIFKGCSRSIEELLRTIKDFPYQPGYTAPPPPPQLEDATIDIRQVSPVCPFVLQDMIKISVALTLIFPIVFCFEGWTLSGAPLDLHDPRILAMAAAEQADYDEYADTNASGAAFCRSAALILRSLLATLSIIGVAVKFCLDLSVNLQLMALLLLRHALYLTNGDEDDDAYIFFSLFLLRAAGFLLPCYIMAWAISIMQRRRQRQDAAALAATEVAFMIQAGQRQGAHFTVASGPSAIPHQEPLQ